MIKLRLIKEEDRELLFKWRNLPEIIENSLSQKGVTWEEHDHFFSEILSLLFFYHLPFIIIYRKAPIGLIRFVRKGDDFCEIHIYLLKKYRRSMFGSEALEKGIEQVNMIWPGLSRIEARVKKYSWKGRDFFLKHIFREDKADERCWTLFRWVG